MGSGMLGKIYGRRDNEAKSFQDGLNSYRSHAFAHQPP